MFRFMHKRTQRKAAQQILLARAEKERNLWSTISTLTPEAALDLLDSSKSGLSEFLVEASSDYYGPNVITQVKRESPLKRFALSFVSPFTGILFLLALVSFITDYSMMPHGQRDLSTVLIILVMILLSGLMTFIQEFRGDQAAQKLSELVENTIAVTRKDAPQTEIPMDEVVVGDIVHLAAGDMVPADLRILEANDLFIIQSAMTGESEPVEKSAAPVAPGEHTAQMDIPNLAFMGTNVQSGSALGIVYSTGDETVLGQMAGHLSQVKPEPSAFDKGLASVSRILIRFMLVMVPLVFLLNVITKRDGLSAFLFSISIAVGLTPQMLPMIVSTVLARGAVAMSRKDTIIKNVNAIQNMGAMDILCTDKTGTLTQDRVVLEYHLDIEGEEDPYVLRYAFLNSYYQTGLNSLMDESIILRTHEESEQDESLRGLTDTYTKVDEIPFDFERRRLSVMVKDDKEEHLLVTKGAVEEMLSICDSVRSQGQTVPMDDTHRQQILRLVDELNDDGMRVIGVALRDDPPGVGQLSKADEVGMVFIGILAFLDPPKESTQAALEALREHGVETKILTGDNERVTASVCKQVGLKVENILMGADVDGMDDQTLSDAAERTQVFAKLSPLQKARVVTLLRARGHVVGYMGDGINDAAAMRASDVGVSVDNAVDIAKESAQVILLKKDLIMLERGLIEGRKVYANLIKYIKITASSNFGNMLSVLVASALLPFLPMAAIHLLLLNLVYDITCLTLPFDNVDRDYLLKPRRWQAHTITSFMLRIGPVSSIFDILTYALMFFLIAPQVVGGQWNQLTAASDKALFIALFQAGWFVLSMWTQTLVVHMIRTEKIPFVQSRAALPVWVVGLLGCLVMTLIPYIPLGAKIGLAPLPFVYFLYLAGILLLYMLFVTGAKWLYIKRHGELL